MATAALAAAGLLAVVVQGLGLALPAVWLGLGFFLVCAFAGGAAHGVKNVMFRSLIHLRVPERLHGRAFAAFNGLRNTAELAAFGGGGLLVAAIGARGTLPTRATLSALAGLVGLIVLLRRNYGWVSLEPGAARRVRRRRLLEQLGVRVRCRAARSSRAARAARRPGSRACAACPARSAPQSPARTSNDSSPRRIVPRRPMNT